MNMLTSLKALLFPATGVGQAPAGNAVAAEGIDFSALLNGVTDMPKATSGQAVAPPGVDAASWAAPLPLAQALSQDATIAPLPVIADAAPPIDHAPVVDETHPPLVDPTVDSAGEPTVPVSAIAEITLPDALLPPASEQVAVAEIAPKLNKPVVRHQEVASTDFTPSELSSDASQEAVGQGEAVQQEDAPLTDVPDGQPKDVASPQIVPPPVNVAVGDSSVAVPAALTDVPRDVRAGAVSSSISAVPVKSDGASPQIGDVPSSSGSSEAAAAVSPIADAATPMAGDDIKAVLTAPVPTEIPAAPRSAGPVSRQNADVPSPSDLPQPGTTNQQPFQAAPAPTQAAAPATPSEALSPIADTAVPAPALPVASDKMEPKASHAVSRPSIAEALSLLQLAREQLRDRTGNANRALPERSGDPAASAPIGTDLPVMPVMTQHGVTPQVTPQVFAAPAMVDLSASLGAQVVDMGVSGQWIDGLARDIASFSADGAQGRFRIDAGQLGPVQVDIRQGADGAAVSLTVASDVAEQMLRQEGDRLKLDAGLAAVRISDVKVERAHIVAEPSRADGAGAQSSGQQSTGSQAQGGAWTMQGQGWGQSSAQSHMQGRGQGRENFGAGAKSGRDPAVLNHEQSGGHAAERPRARYA